ncbi:MAG: hypothetical protein KC635_25870 [Myxococcales bacterium]|nr:hypothetical protein [Myxococcales bacterium]
MIALLALGACASAPPPPTTPCPTPPPCPAVDLVTTAPADPLGDVSIPPLPDWTNRYAAYDEGDVRFFLIEEVMRREGLTRWQAVELQNHYRDLSRAAAEGGPDAWYAEALRRVRAGEYESGYDAAKLAAAPAIVVFDLDDTLYDQRVARDACAQLVVGEGDGARHIALAPGWEDAFARLRKLGVAIAIFTANLDAPSRENLAAWTWEGKPLLGHPDIAAVMTNSYLVRQSKHEGPGKEKPSRGEPVMEASKDLRLFDESLERAIIVDDNPARLMQPGNARVPRKLDGDLVCDGDAATKKAQSRQLGAIVDEVADALAYAKGHPGVTFARAYRPFTLLGQVAVGYLVESGGMSAKAARDYVRAHPEAVSASF